MERINPGGRGEALKRHQEAQSSGRAPYRPEADNVPPRVGGRGALFSTRSTLTTQNDERSQGPTNGQSIAGFGRANFFERVSQDVQNSQRGQSVCSSRSALFRAPSETQGLGRALSSLSLQETSEEREERSPVIAKGTSGEKVTVVTNYFELQVEEGRGIYLYNVKFNPDVESKSIRKRLLRQVSDVIKDGKTFDGAMLYLPYQLPEKVTTRETKSHDGSSVTIKITFIKMMKMADREAIQLFNILFKNIMSILGFVLHGRNFYDPHAAMPIPEHKLEVWPGYITAIQEFEGGVMLCCDASHRVLRTQTVYELITDYPQNNGDDWESEVRNLLIGQTVLTRYNNKVYRIDDVDFESTPRDGFMKQGEQISYVDYYYHAYNVQIEDVGQPLLKSKVKTKIRGEEMTEFVSLIPELCFLTGITDGMRNDHRMMKAIAHYTRISPAQRQAALEKFVTNVHNSPEASGLLSNWGLRVASRNVHLPGRLLKPEVIMFQNSQEQTLNSTSDWSRGATSNRVCSAIDLSKWVILVTRRDENLAREFVRMMQQVTPKLGIAVLPPTIIGLQRDHVSHYLQEIRKLKEKQAQLVVAILPTPRTDMYAAIKKSCCVENPCPSQVIIARTIRDPKKLRSVTQKIALQINCKLGGTLWEVPIPSKNTMVMGLDTFHDAARASNSVSAIVASINDSMTRWYSTIYRQNVGLELIDGLEMAVTRVLAKWRELRGELPKQIIVYRDGVGDGQLDACSMFEVPQMIRAGKKLSPDYSPKFLFVVVQKRINTRLFAYDHKELINPYSGTVMDHTITRRNFADFYLVSQNVRQGTVSPTHYVILKNDTSMTPDQVQRYSYKMTHLYYNWCGTIRVAAPCQYAHKLAYLVGEHIHKEADESLADKLFYL